MPTARQQLQAVITTFRKAANDSAKTVGRSRLVTTRNESRARVESYQRAVRLLLPVREAMDKPPDELPAVHLRWACKMNDRQYSDRAKPGKHYFGGEFVPPNTYQGDQATFSVGCFRAEHRVGGGVKRGKVLVRVLGRCEDRDMVLAEAWGVCKALDAGTYDGPKRVTVRAATLGNGGGGNVSGSVFDGQSRAIE